MTVITPEVYVEWRKQAVRMLPLTKSSSVYRVEHERIIYLIDALDTATERTKQTEDEITALREQFNIIQEKWLALQKQIVNAQNCIANLDAVRIAAEKIVAEQFVEVDSSNAVKYARAVFALKVALLEAGYAG